MFQIARTTALLFAAGFLALFLLRLGYGYWQMPNGEVVQRGVFSTNLSRTWDFASGLKNYASKKIKQSRAAPLGVGTGADQKYEKIANVGLRSKSFDEDEGRVRTLIKSNSALIQYEQRQGLKGRRLLQLAIGVSPPKFDSFVDEIQTYGKLTQLTINKSDKTNEYRELQAKRVSLEKTREALTLLKSREGKIPSMIELEKQILSLEQQIQALGVSLGDFDAENEFVTVKLLLSEAKAAIARNISFARRALVAFVWTAKYYALLWFGLAAAVVAALAGTQLFRILANALPKIDPTTKA